MSLTRWSLLTFQAAGLATMISTMRPDIDNMDEYVRNTTARAFAVVAFALGIPSLLPFLKAVCKSKKSWQARHTGIKIVQQIAILMGCAILPHLRSLVEIIEHGKLLYNFIFHKTSVLKFRLLICRDNKGFSYINVSFLMGFVIYAKWALIHTSFCLCLSKVNRFFSQIILLESG